MDRFQIPDNGQEKTQTNTVYKTNYPFNGHKTTPID